MNQPLLAIRSLRAAYGKIEAPIKATISTSTVARSSP